MDRDRISIRILICISVSEISIWSPSKTCLSTRTLCWQAQR